MLSDQDIAKEMRRRRIVIDPPPPVHRLQPASVDVTLGGTVRVFEPPRRPGGRTVVRLDAIPDDLTDEIDIGAGFRLRPGDFVLATTAEHVTLPANVCAFLHGRSTLGRLGLAVHCTAGLIDPGFAGHITLEVSNISAELILELRPGDPIGQLTFERMSSAAARPYGSEGLGSRYQHQSGTTPPRGARAAIRPVPDVAPVSGRVAPVLWLRPGGSS